MSKKTKPDAEKAMAAAEPVAAYKGFDQNWQCRGFQYAIGETYAHEGPVKHCESGFHACEHPLNVFDYYPPTTSRFALVECAGEISREEGGDTKIACAQITIKAELSIPQLMSSAISWVMARCTPEGETATGYRGAASSTGDRGAASSTGYQGAASSTGDQGAASSTGYRGAASSTGYRGAASSTGKHGVAMACGFDGKAMAAETSAIVLVHRNGDGSIKHIRAAVAGTDGVKAGVWYSLDADGQFVEVSE